MLDLPDQVISTIRNDRPVGRLDRPIILSGRDRVSRPLHLVASGNGFIVALTRDTGHHTGGW